MSEWFERWFGEEYLELYSHRDEEEAAQLVALLGRVAPWRAGDPVLDLGCGAGRHAALVAASPGGARVVGFDLSPALLRRARARVRRLVRGDMRALPFRRESFRLALNLFTSFGYFADDGEHARVLAEVRAVLAPDGRFVLDYLNADHVRQRLEPHEELQLGGRTVCVERHLSADGRFVVKEIHLRDDNRSFLERVRLFSPAELAAMLGCAGFGVAARFGAYVGGPLDGTSPRAIFIAEPA